MGKIIISENATLDGVIQDPTGEEGFRHGGWFNGIADTDREAWARAELDEVLAAEALLLGRRSYEFFAARWPSRQGAFADRLNSLRKGRHSVRNVAAGATRAASCAGHRASRFPATSSAATPASSALTGTTG